MNVNRIYLFWLIVSAVMSLIAVFSGVALRKNRIIFLSLASFLGLALVVLLLTAYSWACAMPAGRLFRVCLGCLALGLAAFATALWEKRHSPLDELPGILRHAGRLLLSPFTFFSVKILRKHHFWCGSVSPVFTVGHAGGALCGSVFDILLTLNMYALFLSGLLALWLQRLKRNAMRSQADLKRQGRTIPPSALAWAARWERGCLLHLECHKTLTALFFAQVILHILCHIYF
jgi:hypothetical protein